MRYDPQSGITILAIDDDQIILTVISRLVKAKLPWKILTANTASKGLQYLRKQPIHLVLLDINMPNVDGFKTLDLIQYQEEFNGIPVVFVTSQIDSKTVVKARMANIDDYIKKPIVPKEMVERITGFIKKYVKFQVLAIDDEPIPRKLVKASLEKIFPYNVEVLTASSATEGLEIIDGNEINLLIIDDDMPVIDGLRMIEMLRAREEPANIPVIFMPGELGDEDRNRVVKLGLQHFVEKPFKPNNLLDAAMAALNLQPPPEF